jgi:hypothetical protein
MDSSDEAGLTLRLCVHCTLRGSSIPLMSEPVSPQELFRRTMAGEQDDSLRLRRFFRHLPADPRCKNCNSPFGLPGSLLARAMGRTRWPKNPRFCGRCYTFLLETGTDGAEVEVTMLFADVRGSTALAERGGIRVASGGRVPRHRGGRGRVQAEVSLADARRGGHRRDDRVGMSCH